ncbi:hypothetical protein FRC06_006167 [Ceratobasidium sp. 370]|nr:hypothetical protein FRC06_006167 [Ceratobasidium sp. 370]
MSSQRRDFRRMLYRLDLATQYLSIPALIQHFMDQTVLDGVVEVKMVASPPMSAPTTSRGKRSTKPPPPPLPPLQPTTSVISFRREGREVNAIALYGPASAPTSVVMPEGSGSYRSIDAVLAGHDRPGMVVKKRYPPRTTLVWVFAPLVQKLLDEGADTVLFEVRSYIAGADSVRESQSGPSPVSPYGTSHSMSAPSPSVLASESTPGSGGVASALDDFPASQYAPSPSHPVAETEAPILTELHRRPRDLRAEASSYEAPRPRRLRSPVQRHASMPMPFPSSTPSTSWSYPQSNQWAVASGYHDLQSLPPPPTWEPSFNSEGWSEHAHPPWQPEPISEPYAYPAIPPLPWQTLQDPAYAPSALDPVLNQPYLDSLTPQSFNETYYTPDTSFSGQAEFSASPQGVAESQASGVPATFQGSSGMSSEPVQEAVNWQAQYPYLGALDIPPVDAFSYSPAPPIHSEGRRAGVTEPNRPSDAGSPDSPPPPSSDRDSLTPTLTNPGYDRAAATTPRQQWPFVRGPSNQPTQPVSGAYTPQSHSMGAPGPSAFRSFSETIPRPRIRMRSRSPEHTPESPRRGAKRLKVSAGNTPGSRVLSLTSRAASPPPLSAGSSSSQPKSIKSRVSSTIASVSGIQRSLRTVSPADQSPIQDQQEPDTALLEILTRPAPYRRMLGYAARQQDGSIVAYELSDSVAATTGDDTLLGLGLSNVTNVAALGMELGRRAAQRQNELPESSSRGAAEPTQTPNVNVHGEHGNPRPPRGGDGWRGHIRGASGRAGWQGCVVA